MRKPRCHYRLHIQLLPTYFSSLSLHKQWTSSVVESKNIYNLDDMAVLFQQLMEYEKGIPCYIRREYRYAKYYNPETQQPRGLEELARTMTPRTYERERKRRDAEKN